MESQSMLQSNSIKVEPTWEDDSVLNFNTSEFKVFDFRMETDSKVNVDTFLHKLAARYTHEKSYKCEDCGASLNEFGKLKCHIRTHTGEKPCDFCAAVFTMAGNLKCHIRTYTGEKPYKCDGCGALYTTTGNLKYHMRTHIGEKPYKCDVCGLSLIGAGSLKSHMRTHTGEKPYECDVLLQFLPRLAV
ncbi:hypothetical protein BsWGS_03366 [Bradybaena similaris]